jgi:hypothetical protein
VKLADSGDEGGHSAAYGAPFVVNPAIAAVLLPLNVPLQGAWKQGKLLKVTVPLKPARPLVVALTGITLAVSISPIAAQTSAASRILAMVRLTLLWTP